MTLDELEAKVQFYQIANFDLMWCERYLIAYVELMTPVEHGEADAWLMLKSREHGDDFRFIDICGRSLVTSIVIAYSRPWSNNKDLTGNKRRLNKQIFQDMSLAVKREDPDERALSFHMKEHNHILRLRGRVVGHSDAAVWDFDLNQSEFGQTETTMKDPFPYLSVDDARKVLENTQSLRTQIGTYRSRILRALSDHADAKKSDV